MHDLFFGNLRPAPLASQQPRVRICEWRIVRTHQALYLVGAVAVNQEVLTYRISSAIEHVDVTSRQVRTSSGRVYEIEGPPASEIGFVRLLDARLAEAGLGHAVDVSAAVWGRDNDGSARAISGDPLGT
jgi:hypothetical protein